MFQRTIAYLTISSLFKTKTFYICHTHYQPVTSSILFLDPALPTSMQDLFSLLFVYLLFMQLCLYELHVTRSLKLHWMVIKPLIFPAPTPPTLKHYFVMLRCHEERSCTNKRRKMVVQLFNAAFKRTETHICDSMSMSEDKKSKIYIFRK